MNFSIVIVTYNRKKHLERCLMSIRSILQTTLNFEVIIIFNGENSYMSSTKKQFPEHSCFSIASCTPSEARNYGISKVKGKYIFFLDDDCTLPPDYFTKLDFDLDWDVLGGPDKTTRDASSFQKILGHTLSSPLCTGMTYKRHSHVTNGQYNSACTESSLILCNLWMKASLFQSEGYKFSSALFRNEENFLLKELKKNQKILHFNPALYVYHFRKDNINNLSKAIMKSGECRVLSFFKMPAWSELVYLLPIAFTSMIFYWIFHPTSIIGVGLALYVLLIYAYIISSKIKFEFKIVAFHFYILITYSIGLLIGLKLSIESLIKNQLKRLVFS